ncbi:MAG: rod shape-determining protein RodA [Clostridia bacterium]|nr:rod shape-determining protein RodA [Oscillospiraceae bacterium]MBQ7959893.1 rod shape-determining protein RodA [Clostridia bacterium]
MILQNDNLSKHKDFKKNFDFLLFFLTLAAAVFGIVMISSAAPSAGRYVLVQTAALFMGLGAVAFLIVVDYEYLASISGYLYIVSVILLILVLIPGIGTYDNGARSWFRFGSLVGVQPAELVKLAFIITFAKHLSVVDDLINRPRNVVFLLIHAGILIGLILLQPDFGTAVVFGCIMITMLFTAKISWKYIGCGIGAVAAVVPLAWFFVLKDYQKERIINLFNPENDPSGTGYQVAQSKMAIGSGKIFGSGLYQGGSQHNNFLPERHTDFIFSVVCEELGFVGAVLVVALLVAIIVRCIIIGINARNNLGMYICLGVAAMFTFHVVENVGMCIGIMPVTGIPLPFFSYGGSSLLTNMIAIGMVLNVKYRSKVINF